MPPVSAVSVNSGYSPGADSDPMSRRFRILMIVDQFARECPAIEPDLSLTGKKVVAVLERLRRHRGLPESITVSIGSEFRFQGHVLEALPPESEKKPKDDA